MIRIFRYLPLQAAISSIEDKEVLISDLSKLNDPFDCLPAIEIKPPVPEIIREGASDSVVSALSAGVGILSFSGKWKEPVLWSHYADSHRGVALVFDFPDEDLQSGALVKVSYETYDRVKVAYDLTRSPDEQTIPTPEFVKRKAPPWVYEDEYRVFLDHSISTPKNGRYFREFDSTNFRGVVIGLKCELRPEYFRQTFIRLGFKNAKAWKVKLHPEKFLLENDPTSEKDPPK